MGSIRRRNIVIPALLVIVGSTVGALIGAVQASNEPPTPPWVRSDHTVDLSKAPQWTMATGATRNTVMVDAATGQLACFSTPFRAPTKPPPPPPLNAQAQVQQSLPEAALTPEVRHVTVTSIGFEGTPGVKAIPPSEVPAGATCTEDSSAPTVFILNRETGKRVTVPGGRRRQLPDPEDR
jgi:hypothetical protein